MSTPDDSIYADDLYDTLAPSTVAIVYVHPNQGVVSEPFAQTLAQNCAALGRRVHAVLSVTSPVQVGSRNAAIGMFLEIDSEPNWLLWWDTDMSVPWTAAMDLIATAEQNDAKVATVFGAMMRHGHREDQPWTPVPNAYYRGEGDEYYVQDDLPSEDTPFWCDATGLGFTLIHRTVFENFPKDELPYHQTEQGWGHDIRFFHHAGEKVLYVPTIRAAHWKLMAVDWGIWKAANEEENNVVGS